MKPKYERAIRYLIQRGFPIRLFRGSSVRSPEEIDLVRAKYWTWYKGVGAEGC